MDKILAIVGPTGVGKTSLSVQLAKHLHGEIISCDSMQVYRGMNIGTAKVTEAEKEGIPHYLIDCQSYDQSYNVMIFQKKCRQYIQEIKERHKLPILCGGTGLYLKAALYDYIFEEEPEDKEYTAFLHEQKNDTLLEMLKKEDPESLQKIHPNNRKRLIRALQICHNGKKKSELEKEQKHVPLYDVYFLGLDVDRRILYQRINDRVDAMFQKGLVQEAEALFQDPKTWNYTSFQGIGYKEFKPYFEKQADLETVKEKIKIHSRRYAKRQYTWFQHQMDVHWFNRDDSNIEDEVRKWLYESGE